MPDAVRFETPENIELSFSVAGLGTRFMAWFVDNLLMGLFFILLFIALAIGGLVTDSVLQPLEDAAEDLASGGDRSEITVWLLGLFTVVWGLGSFFYYGLFELFMRGQTPGKRLAKVRVVKSDGFSLDAVSILVRNLFRVLDHIPVLWVVPLASSSGLRFGDMVAGTIVVQEKDTALTTIREKLADRTASESEFRFNPSTLKLLRTEDLRAVEQLLERWSDLPRDRGAVLQDQIVSGLVKRLKVDAPAEHSRLRFLEDLLAAEYRRQNRNLG